MHLTFNDGGSDWKELHDSHGIINVCCSNDILKNSVFRVETSLFTFN